MAPSLSLIAIGAGTAKSNPRAKPDIFASTTIPTPEPTPRLTGRLHCKSRRIGGKSGRISTDEGHNRATTEALTGLRTSQHQIISGLSNV